MNDSPIKIRDLIIFSLLSLIIVIFIFLSSFLDQRTKIVFCDVGQGDAAYIRIKNRVDVLIDAGPANKVLGCLGKHMPFYDRKIELLIISHAEKDHYGGLEYILPRYQIGRIIAGNFDEDGATFSKILKTVREKNITINIVQAGSKITVSGDSFDFFWPAKNPLTSTKNGLSLVCLFQEKNFRAVFTGDATPLSLNLVISRTAKSRLELLKNVEILKVPHHGSKNGLTIEFLKLINPQVAVISAGKNNPYGHPASEILEMLSKFDVRVRRTDKEGDIIFKIK